MVRLAIKLQELAKTQKVAFKHAGVGGKKKEAPSL